jgi:uncharacterized protein (DUF4415 family)
MSTHKPIAIDDDNPEWTAEDFARAKPAADLPSHLKAAFPNTGQRGRPPGSTQARTKRQVTLRLDPEVLEKFKAGGPGWQSRINDVLRKSVL